MAGLAEILFAGHLEELQNEPEAARWVIKRQPGFVLHVTVHPRYAPDEEFLAKVEWATYPGRWPASIVFLDPTSLRSGVASAWPMASGFRSPQDICTTWTAEGFNLHPEWRDDPRMAWDPGDNPILTQLRYLQHELDHTYSGRHS